jgi:hypothetical protein
MKDLESKFKEQKESEAAHLYCKISQAEKLLNQGNYNDCYDLLEDV